ncbi:MAG: DUF357 domain-containing protein [Candidatus Aenigmarchaeota archaeon]|nr:DUF357 domain-containing protein [Candidatus Aenigmarchaeota archaeon]
MALTEEILNAEIKKWAQRLDDALARTHAKGQKGVEYLTNIKAYQSDSLHFLERKDPVRAFEALLWAWAYLQISKDLELVTETPIV